MSVTRRHALVGLGAAGALAATGSFLWTSRSDALGGIKHANPLRIPPLLEGRVLDGRKVFDLKAQHGSTEFFAGYSTPTLGLNGSFLGPTLKCHTGDQVTFNVENTLGFDTTLHWHGFHVPARHDGGPHQVVKPGATWSPSFEVKQKAALFWYHSHLMGHTGEQVNRGLAGLIIVDDDESAALGLPSEYGVDDIPLVVQDRRFNRDGSFAYLTSMHDTMMGFKGDTILVNGTAQPYLTLRRQRTRLRLLNGSNSRIYNFGLENGRAFSQIASDGSLLERPVRRQKLRLAPGERAEIIVDIDPDSRVFLMSYPDVVNGRGGMMGGMMQGMVGNNETFPVLELRAGRLESADTSLPARLTQVPNWREAQAVKIRMFSLDMGMMGMMRMMGGGGMMMGRGPMERRGSMGMMGGQMGINGKPMDMGRIDERVQLGAVEIWAIRNPTPVSHPFHIHDIQFRILDRNGRPPEAYEAGLKDTVLVDPDETVRVIAEFADYADPKQPYMYHCHLLEHEDAGMMGQFVVET